MDVGLARGLAQSLQYDQRIQDERYYAQQMQRAKEQNIAELEAFENDLDYQNAANSYDHNLIKGEANKTIREIGQLVQGNKDWRVNPDIRRQINEKKKYLKSNPNVIRGMQSDAAYREYIKDMQEVAKNPEAYDDDAYRDIQRQYANYLKYGNQNGEDGLKTQGVQAFVYQKPRNFIDLNKAFSEAGNSFKDLKQDTIKGAGQGAYQEYANPATLSLIANQLYTQNKKQIDRESAKVNMTPLEYTMAGIDANIKKQRHLGDFSLQNSLTLRALDKRDKANESKGGSTWDIGIKGSDYGQEDGGIFDQVLGTNKPIVLTGSDGSTLEVTGYETKHTGSHRYMDAVDRNGNKRKVKYVEVYTDIPETVSKEKGFTFDPWGLGDNEINDKFKDKVNVYKKEGKDGKIIDITRVKSWMPIDVNNQAYKGRYDKINTATKFQEAPGQSVDTTGWTQDTKTGEVFDAQGNKRGTIDNYR